MFKLIRLFLPLLIIVFVLPMIMPGTDGKPVMSLSDWLPDTSAIRGLFSDSVNKAARLVGQDDVVIFKKPQLYKWQDEKGRWHFTDKASEASGHAIEEAIPKPVNRMPPPPSVEGDEAGPAASTEGFSFSPTSIPLSDIPKLIDDAKKLRDIARDRHEKLEGI